MSIKNILGIDEVGRGPLAGPVCVGVCAIKSESYKKILEGMRDFKDSKKLSEKKRYDWLKKIKKLKEKGILDFAVGFSSNEFIDKKGISLAIKKAMEKAIKKLKINPKDSKVLLDGSLKASKEFENQKTIIKGDEKELPIALASIVAKITRDEFMIKVSKRYPNYGFEIHKGYGTRAHREIILKNGPTKIHRMSFLRKILKRDRI